MSGAAWGTVMSVVLSSFLEDFEDRVLYWHLQVVLADAGELILSVFKE